jgi:hypothetical protein
MWIFSTIARRLITRARITLTRAARVTRRNLVPVLLFPVLPLMGWGPVTHLLLNKRALDRLKPDEVPDDDVREVLRDEKLKTVFINAGNSVDLIKANNLRNCERFYEYAHNTVPNYFTGDPVMGRYLLQEIRRTGNDPVKRAWGLGWLAHQVSDGFAHKIPHAGCEGWVNSRRVLAGYYRPETEDESVSVAHFRIRLYMADHWLAEMLADCLCYAREKDFIDDLKIDLSIPTDEEVWQASTRILKEFERQLGPGYVYFDPLPDSKLRSISDYYKLIILGSMDVYRAILEAYGCDGLEDYMRSSLRMSRLHELLENSIQAIVGVLKNPENPWEPRRWLPGGSNGFKYSVYEYERIWRPGRYKFGRKEGLLGAIYYNRHTDSLISWASRFAESHDLWPIIRLGIGSLYIRGKGQWPIAAAFIRTLISCKPSNIQDTMAGVARHCGLKKYQEIIPE